MKSLLIAIMLAMVLNSLSQTHPEPETLKPGSKAVDFKLKGVDGKIYSLDSFKDAKLLLIIFSAPHCPTAQAYEDRIIQIQNDFKSKGLQVVMINPNSPEAVCLEEQGYTDLGDSFEEMQVRAREKKFNFPFLDDGKTEETSIKYGPVATPHAFLFDSKRVLQYAGRIDDSEKIGTATQHNLRNAIDALLAGKMPSVQQTKVFGCSIKWKWKNEWRLKLDKDWTEKTVPLEEISVEGLKKLMKNDSEKLRVINVWATWCGPCVAEFSQLVDVYRMYMGRDFELYTVSTDKLSVKNKVQTFLQSKHSAFNNNYIFNSDKKYELIESIDPEWQGDIPYTVIIEPGGKIVWRKSGGLNFLEFRKAIVENPLIGRYF
jgi:thiol-disulfide isomerase/thioredoxin